MAENTFALGSGIQLSCRRLEIMGVSMTRYSSRKNRKEFAAGMSGGVPMSLINKNSLKGGLCGYGWLL
jgi:hypothetical protein